MEYGGGGYGNGNPYPYGALANGIFQGFQMYNMQKDRQDQKADRDFSKNLQTAQFGLQQASDARAAEKAKSDEDERKFQRGLSTNADKRAQSEADRNTAMAPYQQRKTEADAKQAEAAARKAGVEADNYGRKLDIDEMEARARIAASRSSSGRDAAAQDLDRFKLEELQGQKKRREESQDALARYEQLAPLYTDSDAQTSANTLAVALDAVRNGQAPPEAIQGPALSKTLQVMYGRQVKEGIIGKKIGSDRPELRPYGVQPGAEITDAAPIGFKVDPKTGKAVMTVKVMVTNPDGTTASYDNVITKDRAIESAAIVKHFDLNEEANKFYSALGARAQLAQHDIDTPEAYQELGKALRIRAALHAGGDDSVAELKAAGLLPQDAQKITPETLAYLVKSQLISGADIEKVAKENNINWPQGVTVGSTNTLGNALNGSDAPAAGGVLPSGARILSVQPSQPQAPAAPEAAPETDATGLNLESLVRGQ